MSEGRSHWLFVYGSLKRGQANHAELARAVFVATACTLPEFALRMIDGYPALVPGNRRVRGELYRIATPDLELLDEFEGAGYRRQLIGIELETSIQAQAFLATAPSAGVPLAGDEWPVP